MKPIIYDEVTTYPIPGWDKWKIIWHKKIFFRIKKMPDKKYHILINKLKTIKTLDIDGLEMMFICRQCTIKYGKIIKGKKGLLTDRYHCPICGGEI